MTVTPLAVYTGSAVDPTVRVGWAPEAQAFPRTDVLSVPGAQNRTLQVQPSGAGSFDPGSKTFALYAAFAGRVSYQDDTLNSGVGAVDAAPGARLSVQDGSGCDCRQHLGRRLRGLPRQPHQHER